MISTNAIWAGWPSSYLRHIETLAEDFRVIVPDFRGSGRTVHPGGPISYNLLADDIVALIDALHLGRPLVCGYGDGGHVATIIGIRMPASVRAIVNHGGYDLLNPNPRTPGLGMTRQDARGAPDAAHVDPDVVANSEHTFLPTMANLMQADHDGGSHKAPTTGRRSSPWSFDLVQPALWLHRRRPPSLHRPHADPGRRPRPLLLDRRGGQRLPRPARRRVRGTAEHRGRDQPCRRAGNQPVLSPPRRGAGQTVRGLTLRASIDTWTRSDLPWSEPTIAAHCGAELGVWLPPPQRRVSPWAGTAHGVIKAVNTYSHHEGTVVVVSGPSGTCSAPSLENCADSTAPRSTR